MPKNLGRVWQWKLLIDCAEEDGKCLTDDSLMTTGLNNHDVLFSS